MRDKGEGIQEFRQKITFYLSFLNRTGKKEQFDLIFRCIMRAFYNLFVDCFSSNFFSFKIAAFILLSVILFVIFEYDKCAFGKNPVNVSKRSKINNIQVSILYLTYTRGGNNSRKSWSGQTKITKNQNYWFRLRKKKNENRGQCFRESLAPPVHFFLNG